MINTILVALLSFNFLLGNGSGNLLSDIRKESKSSNTGTLKKMIVADGNVAMGIDLNRLNGINTGKEQRSSILHFNIERDSFFTIIVFNDELRSPMPSAMKIIPQSSANLPSKLRNSYQQLAIEKTTPGESYDLVVRDSRTGFTFFNIEGHEFNYQGVGQKLGINMGRMLISNEFAAELGRPSDAGAFVGLVSIDATMRPVEVTQVAEGEVISQKIPTTDEPNAGTVPGPDVVVGDVTGLAQFGSASGTQVGLAVGTDSCNFGTIDLNWFANPNNDHPVIPQNLYRMSGGADNTERFVQIGQSHVKHAFTALTQNLCALGCNGVGGSRLGSGCSDPYSASLNSGPNLGSRAWINPFTGFFPRNDSATPNNSHTGHSHTGPSHRILTEINDLRTDLNPGATYYAEAQYVTPHEYAWCQANPTQCNMYNNVSYRRYNVTGTASPFSFSAVGSTVRTKPAVYAWTGATLVDIHPEPGVDGVGIVAYKVTNTAPNVWHYEYAIYNQNLDRAIGSFSVPLMNGVTLTNIGFHAPPQHPGWSGDGTAGDTGFSNAAWNQTQTATSMTWSTQTFAQNPNANAIRWGTMYNFRFDSNRPPQTANATIGFFKTGNPITVQVQVPSGPAAMVSVSGRVTTSTGQGVSNAVVSLVDGGTGGRFFARTNTFGYYTIENVPSNVTYTASVQSRAGFTFNPQNVQVNDNITNLNFVANP